MSATLTVLLCLLALVAGGLLVAWRLRDGRSWPELLASVLSGGGPRPGPPR